jgi:hypothetical protein
MLVAWLRFQETHAFFRSIFLFCRPLCLSAFYCYVAWCASVAAARLAEAISLTKSTVLVVLIKVLSHFAWFWSIPFVNLGISLCIWSWLVATGEHPLFFWGYPGKFSYLEVADLIVWAQVGVNRFNWSALRMLEAIEVSDGCVAVDDRAWNAFSSGRNASR